MVTYFLGLIREAKIVERKAKDTGALSYHTDLLVRLETTDKDGFLVESSESFQLPQSDYNKLRDAKGKFIAIPHATINTKNGTFTFPDDKISYIIFDRDPLIPITLTTAPKS